MNNDALQLLEVLGATTQLTVQSMYRGRAHRALYAVDAQRVLPRLALYNEQGSDIYFTVNETSESGRDSQHIRALRSIFVDYDHGVPSSWALAPTAVVESSPGKAQCYWVLNDPLDPEEHLDRWQDCMNRWVAATNGDWAARDAARILRLPGFANHKYAPPPPVRLLECNPFNRYPLVTLSECYQNAKLPETGSWVPRRGTGLEPDNLPAVEMREWRFRQYLAKIGGQNVLDNGFYFRKACAGVIDFALDTQLVASVLAEYNDRLYTGSNSYTYDEFLKLANRATSYGKGVVGSAYLPRQANRVEEQL